MSLGITSIDHVQIAVPRALVPYMGGADLLQ